VIRAPIFVTGVSCVGKTTIGARLAELLGCQFFDLDHEVEDFFGTKIGRLQSRFLTIHSFREEAAKALIHLLSHPNRRDCVIALPPSGLMGAYLRVVRRAGGITVGLNDKPENIVERLRFYDIDSRPIQKVLTQDQKRAYLREVKKDITYFRPSYERADLQLDVSGLDPVAAARKVKEALEASGVKMGQSRESKPAAARNG